MNGSIKIIGTNEITRHLQDQVFKKCTLQSDSKLHSLFLDNKKYLLDIKEICFNCNFVLIYGVISDDEAFVGNIALEFYPVRNENLDLSAKRVLTSAIKNDKL